MKAGRLMTALVAGLAMTQVNAQTARSISEDYTNAIREAQTIAAFGPDLFGESVNLKDGTTSFHATDVVAQLNSALPMSIGRSFGVNARDVDQYVNAAADGEMFGNWTLDVPVISGTFDERTGWVSTMANPQQRCSTDLGHASPPGVRSAFGGWNISYTPEQYWHGNTVRIPGKGSYPLLQLPADASRPTDGNAYHWTTKGDWRVRCTPTIRNGSGEGFVVALPDGTRYTFDWMSSRKVASIKDKQCKTAYYNEFNVSNWFYTVYEPTRGPRGELRWLPHRMDGGSLSGGSRQVNYCQTEIVVNRREYSLHATRVEDRYGNWVAYDYDPANPRRLRSVTSNDGASIALAYGNHGKISSVTHNGRTWQYQYASADGGLLSNVVQPDGSRWSYQYGDLYSMLHHANQKVRWADCEPFVPGQATSAVTIGHPSGASGVFSFRSMMHGVDRTPGGCYQPDPDQPLHAQLSDKVMVYKAASLESKQISGPGVAAQTWSYAYQPSWSWNPNGYVEDCIVAACNSTTVTNVTAPDGTITRSTFGNDYYLSAGRLQKVEQIGGGVTLRTEINDYMPDAPAQAYALRVGLDPSLRNNRYESERPRPLRSRTIVQDGTTFVREVEPCSGTTLCFDAYARPTLVRRHNSLGHSTREATTYEDNTAHWVMGQIARTVTPSTSPNADSTAHDMVTSETTFDALAQPVASYRFGKLQQQSSYAADGTLATITDGNGNVTTLGDYLRGVPRLIRHPSTPEAPAGATESATVDGNGWVTSVTDELGSKTCFTHDAAGRIRSIVHPSETQPGVCDASRWSPVSIGFTQVQTHEHGLPPGHWRLHRYEGNRHVNTYFDAFWRPVLEEAFDASDIAGTLTQTVKIYDAMGRLHFTSYPQSGIDDYWEATQGTRSYYDGLGRVFRVDQNSELDLLTTTTEYLPGMKTRVTNPRGFSTTTSYMGWDVPEATLPILIEQPEGKVTQITRHPRFGWPQRMTQRAANGGVSQSRAYVYDGNAQLCKSIEPETGVTVYGMDAAGNLRWSAAGLSQAQFGSTTGCSYLAANGSGRVVNREYDARNRLARLSFPDGRGDQLWSYANDGLPVAITTFNASGNGEPVENLLSYNRRRLLTTESIRQPGWYTWDITHRHDAIGNLAGHTYPTGLSVDYAPNALGQATRAGSYATAATYFPNGALKQFTYGNGIVHTMTQNARQLPQRITSSGVTDVEVVYDEHANPSSILDHARNAGDGFHDRLMTYDGLDRLTVADSCSFGGDCSNRFGYDAIDNLTSWTLAGVKDHAQYVYDASNRLTEVRSSLGAVVHSLGYDAQGNVTGKNGQGYTFDFGNRLRQTTQGESFLYDGFGRRVQSTDSAGNHKLWHYSQNGALLFAFEGSGTQTTNEYVHLAGSLVASINHAWPSNAINSVRYQHTDALGSPVAITSESGAVVERNDYQPFGSVVGKPWFAGIGYAGHVMDAGTGLSYMQQRYYDPELGRFLSVDPVSADRGNGSNFSRYWYADNNPYRMVDPDGRQAADAFLRPRDNPVKPDVGVRIKVEAEVTKMLRVAVEQNAGELRGMGVVALNGAKLSVGTDGKGTLTLPGLPAPLQFDMGEGALNNLQGNTQSITLGARIGAFKVTFGTDKTGLVTSKVTLELGKWGRLSPSVSFDAKYNVVEAIKRSSTGERLNPVNRQRYINACTAENGGGCPSVYFSEK